MTDPSPDDYITRQRRFIWISAIIVILLMVLLGVAVRMSMDMRQKLCPPGNPDCGPVPPSGAEPARR